MVKLKRTDETTGNTQTMIESEPKISLYKESSSQEEDFDNPEMIKRIFKNAISDIESGNILEDLPEFNF